MRDALSFLTVLPVGARLSAPGSSALLAFPVVGLFIGVLWSMTALWTTRLWSAGVAAAMVVLVDLVTTGGLHLDGLADAADGFAARRPPQEAVAIMREGTIGAIGAATLITFLLLRFSLIVLLASAGSFARLALAPVAGRLAMVWAMGRARPLPGSLSCDYCSVAAPRVVLVVAAFTLLLGSVVGGTRGLAGMLAAAAVAELGAALARRHLGGMSGDVAGACGCLAEIAALAALAAGSG